jgi:hypothetical protein
MLNLRRSWRFVLPFFLFTLALCAASCTIGRPYAPSSYTPSYPPQTYPNGAIRNEPIWKQDREKACSSLSWLAIATDECR